jgi:hypothetical protein
LQKKIKTSFWDIISIAFLLLIAGSATVFARSFQTWENPLALIIPLLISVRFIYKYKVRFNRNFTSLILCFLIYYFLLTLKFEEFHYKFLIIYPLSFFIAYAAIMSLKSNFFIIYEELLKYLCGIALFLWVIQLFIPEQLTLLLKSITFLAPYNEIIKAQIGVYTVISEGALESFSTRNSGFAWEPGAFSVFINFAIFINLIRNQFKLKRNWGLYLLILALISTQSTTGYSIFLLIAIFYFINLKMKSGFVLFIPLFIIGVFYLFSLPFMYEKIDQLFNEKITDVVDTGAQEWNSDKMIGAQRFVSFQIDFVDFLNNPILGYGGHDEDMWTKKSDINVVSISGIGKILARFGLVGTLFFIIVLYRSSVQFSKVFNYKGKLILFFLILQVSISYSLIENPIFLCFWMFFYFQPKIEPFNNYLEKKQIKKQYHNLIIS